MTTTYTRTTKGHTPEHAGDPDALAAIVALGSIQLAEVTDHFEPGEDAPVRGALIEPRGKGRVAVYWLEGGDYRQADGQPHKLELRIIANKLRRAGWTVEPKSMYAVFAWRAASIAPLRYRQLAEQAAAAQVDPVDRYAYEVGGVPTTGTLADWVKAWEARCDNGPDVTFDLRSTTTGDVHRVAVEFIAMDDTYERLYRLRAGSEAVLATCSDLSQG